MPDMLYQTPTELLPALAALLETESVTLAAERLGVGQPAMSRTLEKLREAKAVVEECKAELSREGMQYAEDVPIGIMIEMPSAVLVADHLAKEADFFSIGTNDLIQYALALDRLNEHVGYLYQPLHPAVLRMIKMTVEAGHSAGRRVAICGEMAGDPLHTLVLLGMGVDDLSMNAASLPLVKRVLRRATLLDATKLAEHVLTLPSAEAVEATVREAMREALSDLAELGQPERPS